MRKTFKKAMCVVLSAAMIFTSGEFSDVKLRMPWDFSFSVDAAKIIYESDDTEVTTSIVKDTVLLNALKTIVGGGKNITVGQLKNYTGAIDLSNYSGIKSLVGLGYARNAASFNLTSCTGVTTIAREEFYGCNMTKVDLPNTVVELEPYAFCNCTKLSTINLPESITKIHENVFDSCESLFNVGTTGGVKLPSNLIKLGSASFTGCKAIKSVVLPNKLSTSIAADDTSINTMGTSVFANCSAITSVTFGNAMTKVPDSTFAGCSSLASISIPVRFDEIGANAFAKTGLTTINLTNHTNIKSIGESAFAGCGRMVSVSLPACLRIIKDHTFSGCISLTSVTIPANSELTTIGVDAFGSTYSFTKVTFMKDLKKLTTIDDLAFNSGSSKTEEKDVYGDYIYLGGPQEVIIPGGVTYIGQSAFAECRELKKVTIYDMPTTPTATTVRKIAPYAFRNDWNLETIVLPEQNNTNTNMAVEIGDYAFEGCSRINSINFPLCLTRIGSYAFSEAGFGKRNKEKDTFDRYGLNGVNLSKNTRCVDIGEGAFQKCSNLKSFAFPTNLKVIPKKVLYMASVEKNKTTHEYFGLESVNLGTSAVSIEESAFEECRVLVCNKNTLPASLVKIGKKAFKKCSSLGELEFPEKLEEIGDYAFDECSFCDKVDGYSYTIVPGSGLSSVSFNKAKNITVIGEGAFRYTPIKTVEFVSNAPLGAIKSQTFLGCTSLKKLVLSDGVENVMGNAIGGCDVLEMFSIYQTTIIDHKVAVATETNSPTTGMFTLIVRVPNTNIKIRVNEHDEIPIYPLVLDPKAGTEDASGYDAYFNRVKINNNTFTWNTNNGQLNSDSGSVAGLPIVPSVEPIARKTSATKTDYTVQTLQFAGMKEATDIPVQVSMFFNLPTTKVKDGTVGSITVTASVEYKVNVSKVPCESITCEDAYVSVESQEEKKATEVKPVFYPNLTTDVIEWTVLSGNDKVEMKVSDDKKSAKFWSKGTGFGNARVRITAGAITEEFYVYVVAPANSIKVAPEKVNVPFNSKSTLTATIKYDSKYEGDYRSNPDRVKFVSADESIVKIGNIKSTIGESTSKGNTFEAELIAGKMGKTTIKVYAEGGKREFTCDASVVASDLTINLRDNVDDVKVNTGDTVTLYKTNSDTHKSAIDKSSKSFSYSFSSDIVSSDEIEYVVDDDKIAKIESYSAKNKTFKITARHAGKTDITICPQGFDPAINGITFTVNVTADIRGIKLKNKTVRSGNAESIVDSIKNSLGDSIDDSADALSSITNNTLTFKSSNPKIATVNNKGMVYVKNIGPVDITCFAYAPDGTEVANAVCTLTCKIGIEDLTMTKVTDKVYTGKDIEPAVVVKGRGKTLKEGVDYSIKYRNNRRVGEASITIECEGDYDGEVVKTFKILPRKVINLRQVGTGKRTAVTWNKLDEATGYEVAVVEKGKYKKLGTSKTFKFSLKKLSVKKAYKIAVRAYGKDSDGKVYYGAYKVITVTPGVGKAKITKLKVGKKKLTITWKKMKGVNGYEIFMSTKKNKGFKKIATIKKAKKVKFTKKKLKSKKKYYFKVRAYKKVGKKKLYGAFSNVKFKKVK